MPQNRDMDPIATGAQLLALHRRYHPEALAADLTAALKAGGLEWRDPPEGAPAWHGLDFLSPGKPRAAWEHRAPARPYSFPWDGIARAQMGRVGWEWLLVVAFARPDEFTAPAPPAMLADTRLAELLAAAPARYQARPVVDWGHYGRLAGSLALMAFLRQQGACARLLWLFFQADPRADPLAPTRDGWEGMLAGAQQMMGLAGKSALEQRLYRAFVPVVR
jgi:hypothetical protein